MDLCDALLYCHSGCEGGPAAVLLHRDVKPSNVLLYRDAGSGRLVGALGDFGISRLYPEGVGGFASTVTVYGTPGYIAPEVNEGERHSPLSDAYAVGITILQVRVCRTRVRATEILRQGHLCTQGSWRLIKGLVCGTRLRGWSLEWGCVRGWGKG